MARAITRISTLLVVMVLASLCGPTGAKPALANSSPAVDIWYLGHCGYAVKTAGHLLIFDYTASQETPDERGLDLGHIDPDEIADLDVIVFVTHAHTDHYDKTILTWRNTVPRIRYVFGWQVTAGPGLYVAAEPRARLELDGVSIHTVNSHHSGVPEVAYLVQVDGLTLFFEGDYQGRMGRGEPSRIKEDMAYLRQFVDMVDLAFVGSWTGEPIRDILDGLEPAVIFPIHGGNQEEEYQDFAQDLAELGYKQPVPCPAARGDRFVLLDGTVSPY